MPMPGMRRAWLPAVLPAKLRRAYVRPAWVNFIWPIFVILTDTSFVRCTGLKIRVKGTVTHNGPFERQRALAAAIPIST